MVIKVIGYSGSPPQKEEVNEEDFPWIIKHNGNVYQIRESQLRNLGIDYLEDVVNKSNYLGFYPIPSFTQFCLYCNNNANSLEEYYNGRGNIDKNGQRIPGCDCKYISNLDAQVAIPLKHKNTGQVVMAIDKENDCAFYDALISVLVEKGALDQYKVDREFNFPTAQQIEKDNFDKKPYEVKPRTVFKKLRALIRF